VFVLGYPGYGIAVLAKFESDAERIYISCFIDLVGYWLMCRTTKNIISIII